MTMPTILRGVLTIPIAALLIQCGGSNAPLTEGSQATPQPPQSIRSVFDRSCKSCHNSGAGGAPRTANKEDWAPRVTQGLDILLDHTISGYKGMPPMGMCMDCDEDQFIAMIEYMASQKLEP